ncbi:hypothetical protein GFL72_33325 [Rhizobium leguminosarum bv. viciae]|nr:hypothetical protein [Rhizobium leguminosarum bv. viciae]TLW99710.1 hypothetical protein FFR93_37340 [Rhizobium sp. MHM7A]
MPASSFRALDVPQILKDDGPLSSQAAALDPHAPFSGDLFKTTADQQRPAGFSQALAESAGHERIAPRQLSNCLSIVLRLGMISASLPTSFPTGANAPARSEATCRPS